MTVLRGRLGGLIALVLATALAGCATKKIDWAGRIGTYTYEQAVVEIGPPDKKEKLTDGTIVAEWLTRRGYHELYATGGYYSAPYGYWGYPPVYFDTYAPDRFIRLTFGPDGKLQSWKKLTK